MLTDMQATKTRTAIGFLEQEKKQIAVTVSDHINTSEYYRYNTQASGNDYFITNIEKDWDEFNFELRASISFGYIATHERQTHDYPGAEDLEFSGVSADVEVTLCQRWNEENEELQDYRLTVTERRMIEDYFSKNILLTE